MKTTDEILQKHNNEYAAGGLIYSHEAEEAMKEYARQACKEQREKCAIEYIKNQHRRLDMIVLNIETAPEPDLE